jgi:mono/diheme cytochrome c family protein
MRNVAALLLALGASVSVATVVAGDALTMRDTASPAVSLYLERCGGCHGIQGVSAPELVPTLRGQAGHFLCTREGREYLVRLPSVASTPVDDEALAALVNFVAFDLGAGDARYPRFTAAEVRALRKRPLTDETLTAHRRDVVEKVTRECGAPPGLRTYVGPPTP